MDGGGRGGEQEPRFVAPRQDAAHTAPTQNAHFTFDAYPRGATRNSELDMRKHLLACGTQSEGGGAAKEKMVDVQLDMARPTKTSCRAPYKC